MKPFCATIFLPRQPLLLALLLALLLPLLLAGTASAENQASKSDFANWVQKNAIEISKVDYKTPLPGTDELDRQIAGKRIIFLGEPDHYISEKFDYRLMLIKHLITKGFTHIGMELGRSDGKKVDRYLQSGDDADLQLCMYKKSRCVRSDREDLPTGQLGALNPAGQANFIAEDAWFYRRLAELSRPGKLHYFGFDVDLPVGGGYEDVQTPLQPYAEIPAVRDFLAAFARVDKESISDEISRLSSCLAFLAENKDTLQIAIGDSQFKDVFASTRTLRNSFAFTRIAFNNPTQQELHEAYQKREQDVMFPALQEQLDKLPAGEGIILMGHNMHLSKSSRDLSFGPLANPYEALWYTVGSYAADHLPGGVFSIWMMYNEGSHWDLKCNAGSCPVPGNPTWLESTLAEAKYGANFWLPLAQHVPDYLLQPLDFNQNGRDGSGTVGRQVDAIFFVNQVTAPHLREP